MRAIFIFIFTAMFFLTACDDALEEKVYSYDSPSNFYNDADAAVAAVNACYRTLIGYGTIGYWGQMMTELASDITDGNNKYYLEMARGTYDASSDPVRWAWIGWYTGVHNCNTVLERISGIDMDEDLKNRIYGEARFLRAYNHLMLVRLYGGIPLREESVKTADDAHAQRASVSEVYNLIVDDLKFAEKNLWTADMYPESERGRATVEAAKSLLAITYMTMAGEPVNDDSKWELARDKALEVINNRGGYPLPDGELAANYGDLFKPSLESKFHKEHIFSLNHIRQNDLGTPLTTQYAVSSYYSGASWEGGYRYSQHFYDSFEDGDTRAKEGFHHVFYDSDENQKFWPDTNDNGIIPQWGEAPPEGAALADILPAITKYDDPEAPTKKTAGVAIPVIRLAEVLLLHSEAENELNGPTAEALKGINTVRARAGLPPAENVLVDPNSKTAFRNLIIEERAREFFGENKRRFDLLRTGQFIEKMQAAGKIAEKKHLLFPIPLEEMNGNNKITKEDQNPGY
jgi:hypothetical protein